MGNREFVKVAYKGVFNSVKAANRFGRIMVILADELFHPPSIGGNVKVDDGPGTGGTLSFDLVFQSPADSKVLDLVKKAYDRNKDVPYTLSGLVYDTITVENVSAEDSAEFNKLVDENEEQDKRDAEQTGLSGMPAGLASLVASLEAGGHNVTVIRL